MLAKTARVTTADEYRAAVRRGARFVAPNTVTYVRRSDGRSARFGFIVSKAVGVAVTRNLVRRRLKAICYSLQPLVQPGVEIVIRALPSAADTSFETLRGEVTRSFTKASVVTGASIVTEASGVTEATGVPNPDARESRSFPGAAVSS